MSTTEGAETTGRTEHERLVEEYLSKKRELERHDAECKRLREALKRMREKYDKSEDDLKALQSVGHLVGDVLRAVSDEHFIVKTSQGQRYLVGCRAGVDRSKLQPGARVALDQTTITIMAVLPREVDPRVFNMRAEDPGDVKYDEIGGLGEQIRELREVIELPLTNPELFERVGVKAPKGVLLYGPPGTGKTLLARAVASNMECNFLKVVSSAIVDKYIGESARIVREMFGYARDHAPCIIFMDEIDAIGGKRHGDGSASDREIQRTLMELLNQLDGFSPLDKVKVIMATNRPDVLDPALLRPGRLDRKVEIPLPGEQARMEILKIHSKDLPKRGDIDFEAVCKLADGFNGADIRNICTEAGMLAIRAKRDYVIGEDFTKAVRKLQENKKLETQLAYEKGLLDLDDAVEQHRDATVIDASNNALAELPRSVGTLGRLESLRLVSNALCALPDELACCSALTALALDNNRLGALPECVCALPQLRDLDVSRNALAALPPALGRATSLTALACNTNALRTLPRALAALTALRTLDLAHNRLARVPRALAALTALETLLLSGNALASFTIPSSTDDYEGDDYDGDDDEDDYHEGEEQQEQTVGKTAATWPRLSKLDLRGNGLRALPEALCAQTALAQLLLDGNALRALPRGLGALTVLSDLSLSHNALTALPRGLAACTALRRLVADHNALRTLDGALAGAAHGALVELDVRANRLAALPAAFAALPRACVVHLSGNRLAHLDALPACASDVFCNGNRLRALPAALFVGAQHVARLNCSANAIAALPPEIGAWAHTLTALDLAANALRALPPELGTLTALTTLSVAANRLAALPDAALARLRALQHLHCGYNALTDLPAALATLPALQTVHAPGNRLAAWPAALRAHTALRTLGLANNRIARVDGPLALPALRDLDLSHNALADSDAPGIAALAALTALHSLALAQNALTRVPVAAVRAMPHLAALDLSGNRIAGDVPAELLGLRALSRLNLSCNFFSPSPSPTAASAASTYPTAAAGTGDIGTETSSSGSSSSSNGGTPACVLLTRDAAPDAPFVRVDGNAELDRLLVLPAPCGVQERVGGDRTAPRVVAGWAEMCGRRADMQDAMVVVPAYQGLDRQLLAAVYDGHSGAATSALLARRVPAVLAAALQQHAPCAALRECYRVLNADVAARALPDGSAALTLLVRGSTLYAASTGDSRAVLCRAGRAVALTHDHKPTDPAERARIRQCGGFVTDNGRANGILAVSRAIGDSALQPCVTWVPELVARPLRPRDDEFAILACDGVWDVLTSAQAVALVRGVRDPGRAACVLRDYAHFLGSTDNISVVVLRFVWPDEP